MLARRLLIKKPYTEFLENLRISFPCFMVTNRVNIVKMLLGPVLFYFIFFQFKTRHKNISANFRLSAPKQRLLHGRRYLCI